MSPHNSFAQSALSDDADSLASSTPTLVLSIDNKVYLKFKLSSTLPSNTPGTSVAKATIKLYLGAVVSPGTVDVYQLNSDWSEQSIGTDSPTVGDVIQAGVPVKSDQNGKFLVLDVTPAVKKWLGTDGSGTGGAPNYGVALVAGNGASVVFDSKENSLTSHEPQLNIERAGGGTVMSVSADGPLTVTNPNTTPKISLGIVPVSKGGTGLSSSGNTGNVLRSNGSIWTSAPLSASDIPAGNGNYVQNSTTQQAAANFNISGKGAANILDVTTQYNIGGNRMLSNVGTNNVFAGVGAGAVNTGTENAFFGRNAGFSNTNGGSNSFFGNTAGGRNTTGGGNSFFGSFAGSFNSTGTANSFFGSGTGNFNTGGSDNSFFGSAAGSGNTTGNRNSLFGRSAGAGNTTGADNSFFGTDAGKSNTTGGGNTFLGRAAGAANSTGSNLTIIGTNANVGANNLNFATALGAGAVVNANNTIVLGRSADTVQVPGSLNVAGTFGANIFNATTQFNLGGSRVLAAPGTGNLVGGIGAGTNLTTGQNNTFFGPNAGQAVTSATGNSFFGRDTGRVNTGGVNNSFLGDRAGANNTTGNFNSFYGEQTGVNNTTGGSNTFSGRVAGINNTTGSNNTFIGAGAGNPNTSTQVNNSTAIGYGATVSTSNTIVIGTNAQTTMIPGKVSLNSGTAVTFDAGGGFGGLIAQNLIFRDLSRYIPSSPSHLCFRSTGVGSDGGWGLTNCISSLSSANNKTDVQPFSGGLDVIKRLNPVTFKWKADGTNDVGLNAEDVAAAAPQLVTRDDKGHVEDLKEGSLNPLFINAFKEQQKQIEAQQAQIDALKKLVCQSNPQADVCKNQ
jgi:hypothetical protein